MRRMGQRDAPARVCTWAARLALVLAAAGLSSHASAGLRWPTALPEPGAERAQVRDVVVLTVPRPARVRVPGGLFNMGSTPLEMQLATNACEAELLRDACPSRAFLVRSEGHIHEVELSPYDLDRTEVTVEAYDRCVSARQCSAPSFSRADTRFARPRLPVTHVGHEDAVAYCRFAGGRLPTEAEFELAAKGVEGRRYPWGRLWNPHLANHGSLAPDPTNARDGYAGLAEVGAFPDGATPQGVLDLAGNAAEWVADSFFVDGDGFGYSGAKAIDPKGAPTGVGHVVRGGSFLTPAYMLRGAARTGSTTSAADIGFRCAYDARR